MSEVGNAYVTSLLSVLLLLLFYLDYVFPHMLHFFFWVALTKMESIWTCFMLSSCVPLVCSSKCWTHHVTSSIITYRIKIKLFFQRFKLLMINGPESFWRLVFYDLPLKYTDGTMPLLHTGRPRSSFVAPCPHHLAAAKAGYLCCPFQTFTGENDAKNKAGDLKNLLQNPNPPALCITVSSSKTHPDVFSLSLAV